MVSLVLGLLKRIPFKDYIYVAAILALIAFGWMYTLHERAVGAAAFKKKYDDLQTEYGLLAKQRASEVEVYKARTEQASQKIQSDLAATERKLNEITSVSHDLIKRIRVLSATAAASGSGSTLPTTPSDPSSPGQVTGPQLVPAELFTRVAERAVFYAQRADSCEDRLTGLTELYHAVETNMPK